MGFPLAVATWANEQLVGVLRDAWNASQTSGADYIANGTPDSLIGKLNLATARQACRRWAREKDNLSEDRNAAYSTACKPYLEGIGEWPGDPEISTPFTGGQCPGKSYRVTLRREFAISPGLAFPEYILNGPITGVTSVGTTVGSTPATRWLLGHGGTPGQANPVVLGTTFNEICSGTPPVCQPNPGSFTIQSIVPMSGTDDCGNPPVDYEPSEPVTGPLPPTTVIDTDINVQIDVQIGPGGDLVIVYDPGSSDPVETPVDPFAPEPPALPPYAPSEPGDIGEPGSPTETGEGGDADEDEPDKFLIAIKVDLLDTPPAANVRYSGGEAIYIGAAYVYLGTSEGVDLQPEGATMRQSQLFFAPEGSTRYKVSANLGYNLRVTPYYKEP